MSSGEALHPPAVCVRDTGTPRGRGVFATRPFAAGEVVEVCPVVIVRGRARMLPPEIRTIVFDWGVLSSIGEPAVAIALGYGGLYNHSDPANLRYDALAPAPCLRFTAVREIAVHEELTINYNAIGGGPEWHDDNWFERMGVRRI